MGQQVSQLHIS